MFIEFFYLLIFRKDGIDTLVPSERVTLARPCMVIIIIIIVKFYGNFSYLTVFNLIFFCVFFSTCIMFHFILHVIWKLLGFLVIQLSFYFTSSHHIRAKNENHFMDEKTSFSLKICWMWIYQKQKLVWFFQLRHCFMWYMN